MNSSNFKKISETLYCFAVIPSIAHAQLVIGTQAAKNISQHKNGPFYIQLGSFSHRTNALRFEKSIAAKVHINASVIKKNGHYHVRLGPIQNAKEVQEIGYSLDPKMMEPYKKNTAKPTDTPTTYHPEKEPLSQPVVYLKQGPYLGVSAGPIINVTGGPYSYGGVEGTLFGGYSALKNDQYYLAAEVFVGDSLNIHHNYDPITGTGVQTSWGYGADLIPGLRISHHDGLIYLRGGFENSHFSNINQTRTGWRAGMGSQLPIYSTPINLRMEYVLSGYHRSKPVDEHFGRIAYVNQFNLGILYQFDRSRIK